MVVRLIAELASEFFAQAVAGFAWIALTAFAANRKANKKRKGGGLKDSDA